MRPRSQLSIVVRDASAAGAARRASALLAAQLGLDAARASDAAIVVTELVSNLVQHGGGGELLLGALATSLDGERDDRNGDARGLELVAIDRGPGMADVERCLQDGFSTAGTPGNGLGAIRRLSHELDLYSQPGAGTVVLARLWVKAPLPSRSSPPGLTVGAVCVPMSGESVCGDAWAVRRFGDATAILVADGLGHGPAAAEAAESAIAVFTSRAYGGPEEVLRACHGALKKTRGAAVAVAWLDGTHVRYAGVGNLAAQIVSASGVANLVTHNGTIGYEAPRFHAFSYPRPPGAQLVVCTDGISSRYRLDGYPGITRRHPTLAAALLYRDFGRRRDDATVVTVRPRDA